MLDRAFSQAGMHMLTQIFRNMLLRIAAYSDFLFCNSEGVERKS